MGDMFTTMLLGNPHRATLNTTDPNDGEPVFLVGATSVRCAQRLQPVITANQYATWGCGGGTDILVNTILSP